MNILQIGILIFAIIETTNILMLYFNPSTKLGNAVGIFTAWDKSKEDEEMNLFAHYMAWWVAGAKLIFILLGLVIIVWGNIQTQVATCAAMVISIASFYFKLYPTIKQMDSKNQIDPKGYSKALFIMITVFIIGFSVIFVIGLFQYIL